MNIRREFAKTCHEEDMFRISRGQECIRNDIPGLELTKQGMFFRGVLTCADELISALKLLVEYLDPLGRWSFRIFPGEGISEGKVVVAVWRRV